MSMTGIPGDLQPLDPKTGRWKTAWFSWLNSISSSTPISNVAGLPASAKPGMIWHASDGLKPGESTGHGTGTLVYYDGAHWINVSTGAAVAA